MNKQRKRQSTTTLLSRDGVITSWRASLFVYAERRRGGPRERKGRAWLVVEGELTEPVAGVSGYSIHMFPGNEPSVGQSEIPSVGSFIRTKPMMEGVIELSEREFGFISTLLSSGRVLFCSVAFQPPRYGRALIASIDFSSAPPTSPEEADQMEAKAK
ncbi:hypothetical protein PCE31106_04418 [Pandoraea cepalis]|uniref:Uncharacterized protein n=1 Tax=Pandoraea cepalis TaxID=2508294 RepID=A0A5E4YDJ0_9BURK|nr:hypothetical protein [Pandoraea cepalis]VVE46512.1 hypothetical protein PCE31106_04418 [Pandoraea cepalis]